MSPLSVDPEPAVTAKLLERYRNAMSTEFGDLGARHAQALAEQAAKGWVHPLSWHSVDGSTTGLVYGDSNRSGLRVWGVHIDPPSVAHLRQLLADLHSERGPLISVIDLLPGIRDDVLSSLLEGMGFWHFAKVQMRFQGEPAELDEPDDPEIRSIRGSDLEALVKVYAQAYSNRPGEFWVDQTPDPAEDGREYLQGFLFGKGNRIGLLSLPEFSFVWEDKGTAVGGIFVAKSSKGDFLIDNLMVDPAHHREGIGRKLVIRSIRAMRSKYPTPIDIVAIRDGAPYHLYRKLGFQELPPPEGKCDGRWVCRSGT